MRTSNKVDLLEVFGDREKEVIIRVLERYQISEIIDIKKIKTAYKVETNKEILCLKKMKTGVKRTKNLSGFVEELTRLGFYNTPKYVKTLDGKIFVKYKDITFYAIEWIDSCECNLDNIVDAQKCMQTLAKFHLASSKIDSKKMKLKNNIKNWPQIFNYNIIELEKFKKIIKSKRLKNEFDLAYLKFIDNYISRGSLSLKILNNSNYYLLYKLALDNKTLCQDNFHFESSLIKGEQSYILDLSSIVIDLQINEVSKIIRKLMNKNEYQWDFSKAKILIEAYNSENKLTKADVGAMLALIIFPHKFCKLGEKRYIKYKNWNEIKYMHNLNRFIKYNELQQEFIEDYLNFISDYV
ncbi:MAG: CotS family spore coat protein [Clostridiaceae bacterium]|nr:CotS family spore coat protein [Clostridiaceae bacterium]